MLPMAQKRVAKKAAKRRAAPVKAVRKSGAKVPGKSAAKKSAAKSAKRPKDPGLELAPARIEDLLRRLGAAYPSAECALKHTNAWELLVATILSAQCTDVRVNMVTPVLFEKYPTPDAFAALGPQDLEDDIRSTGFFRNKSKSLVGAARKIVGEFGGEVPRTMDELLQIPGVARKTANVVLGTWYKIADGVVVDTHVQRISRRLELTKNEDPRKIEQDLMKVIPRSKWIIFAHQIILHGRALCLARNPKCADCPLENLCHAADKTWSTVEVHKGARP
jgi:endonuclease III